MNFKIGEDSSIHLGCRFNTSELFIMNSYSTINQFCHIDNRGGVEIGNYVSISPKVSIVTADHDLGDKNLIGRGGPVIIKDDVFIGYSAIILKDCVLEKGSVIGAASLVTKSTEPYGIYFGIPAKFKKERNRNFKHDEDDYKRLFH